MSDGTASWVMLILVLVSLMWHTAYRERTCLTTGGQWVDGFIHDECRRNPQ